MYEEQVSRESDHSVIGDVLATMSTILGRSDYHKKSNDKTRGGPIMRNKQGLKVRRPTPTILVAPSSSEALEQQVREHPVVQEVMRLFNARIVAIVRTGASEGDRRPAVEQQPLCFSSQEA